METATEITDVQRIRQEFEKCLQRKRDWDIRFSRAWALATVLDDFTELDKMGL